MKKIKAFTLTEVLIVLAIIGTLSAMTLPSLKNNVDFKKRIMFFQKAKLILVDAYSSYYNKPNHKKPKKSTVADANNLFTALKNELNIDYYYTFTNGEAVKSYSEPSSADDATEYSINWIKTSDGIAYLIEKPEDADIDCQLSTRINEHTTTEEAKANSCMYVTADYNGEKGPNLDCATQAGITEDGETVISDDAITHLGNCDRITFFLSDRSFATGNPDMTVGGKITGIN